MNLYDESQQRQMGNTRLREHFSMDCYVFYQLSALTSW